MSSDAQSGTPTRPSSAAPSPAGPSRQQVPACSTPQASSWRGRPMRWLARKARLRPTIACRSGHRRGRTIGMARQSDAPVDCGRGDVRPTLLPHRQCWKSVEAVVAVSCRSRDGGPTRPRQQVLQPSAPWHMWRGLPGRVLLDRCRSGHDPGCERAGSQRFVAVRRTCS
jgi:hypothetical protein